MAAHITELVKCSTVKRLELYKPPLPHPQPHLHNSEN